MNDRLRALDQSVNWMNWRCRYDWLCLHDIWFFFKGRMHGFHTLNIISFWPLRSRACVQSKDRFSASTMYMYNESTIDYLHKAMVLSLSHPRKITAHRQQYLHYTALNFALQKIVLLPANRDTTRNKCDMDSMSMHSPQTQVTVRSRLIKLAVWSCLFISASWLNLLHHRMWLVCMFDYPSYMWFN